MKRTNTFFAMTALLLAGVSATVSCGKDEEQPAEGKTYHMTVTASKGGESAKALTVDGTTISATWAAGEEVTVYNVTKGAALEGTLAAQSSGASTTLEGTLTGTIEAGDELTLKFCSPDYSMQDGTLAYIAANCDYAEATVTVASVEGGRITATAAAAFVNKQAIVKFTLMDAGSNVLNASVLSVTVDDVIYATIPASATNELFVALPGISGQAVTLSAKVGRQWYNKTQANVTFVNGQYYTVAARLAQKGMLPGTFSVGGSKKVHFSQGNLLYENGTWKFHANQYDYLGGTSHDVSESGSTDLFGWVGASSTWEGVKQYGVATERYDFLGKADGYGNVANESLKADWGTLAISNGGNAANSGWYTSSIEEWKYLFDTRTSSTVGGTDNAHYAKAYLFGTIHGFILFPDKYTHPAGVAAPTGVNCQDNTSWNANTYNAGEWAKMEAAGAVFLPVAGFRKGTEVGDVGDYGNYQSSSADIEYVDQAWYVQFGHHIFDPSLSDYRYYGNSVRLLCE